MPWFDGTSTGWPKVVVKGEFGPNVAHVCVRGTGVRGTNVRGGRAMVDVSAHVRSVEWSRGRSSPIDSAEPGVATVVLNNGPTGGNGAYDPTNFQSPYVFNRLDAETEGLEGGTVGAWVVGGSCTIANSTAQAHSGTHSLALTSTVSSGGIWVNTASGIDVSTKRGEPYQASVWARSATHAVSMLVAVRFKDAGGDLLQQDNSPSVGTLTSGWVQPVGAGLVPGGAASADIQALFFDMASVGEVHYVDDSFLITGTLVDLGAAMIVQAERPTGMLHDRFTGEIVDISLDAGLDPTVTIVVADGLENIGRTQLITETAQFAGDYSGQRVNNLADRAAWPVTARLIDQGQAILNPTTFGANTLELMRQVESTEFGFLFVDAHGNLVFYERHRAENANRSVTVQARLTDTSGAGEIGMVDLVIAKSRERVYNDVHITRQPDVTQDPEVTGSTPGDVPTEQVARNASSIAQYGTLSFPTEIGQLLRSDVDAQGLAAGVAGLYGGSPIRIREVRVNALHPDVITRDLWATILGIGLLDRIAVSRDYGPNTIAGELLVQQITETITSDPVSWELRLTTSNPPPATHYCVRGEGIRGTDVRGW